MKILAFSSLLFFELTSFAYSENHKLIEVISDTSSKHLISQKYSNEEALTNKQFYFERNIDFPTQIVRFHAELKNYTKKCSSTDPEIKAFFTGKIEKTDLIYYNIFIQCQYDPKTEFAISVSINAYLDPLTDEAVEYLKTYISEHNGHDLLGTRFEMESARGLVVSLNIDAGIPQDEYATVLLRYQHDNKTLYFPNNYEMLKILITDIKKNFYSNDAQYILPFMTRWFYSHSAMVYGRVLKMSSYVELQPERIFTMERAPFAYTSPLRMYYSHSCKNYPNKKCL